MKILNIYGSERKTRPVNQSVDWYSCTKQKVASLGKNIFGILATINGDDQYKGSMSHKYLQDRWRMARVNKKNILPKLINRHIKYLT